MASIKRRHQEDDHEAKKAKISCVSDASELKGQHPVVLNPADCDLGISFLSGRLSFLSCCIHPILFCIEIVPLDARPN